MKIGIYARRLAAASLGVAMVGSFNLSGAQATEGYFSHGFGVINSALAGAGVADSKDAMSIAINPAGLVDVGTQFNGGVTIFGPFREYTATGTGFIAPGTIESSSNIFAIPNLGYSYQLGPGSAVGISLYGNGGMNTDYKNITNTGPACTGASGVFCSGDTGIDLNQAFISVGYARRFGNLSIGVAPIIGIQLFKADGLGAFAGVSSSQGNLTGSGYDVSAGFGARVGLQYNLSDEFRFGASYQSKIYMSKFSKYAGLFEDGGDFDVPANLTVGIAWDALPDLTFLLDYKRIFYSGIDAIGNSSVITGPGALGSKGGPGFGWSDINIYKFGAEWKQNDQWTWRAGYAYNDNPVSSSNVTLNVLAPGIVQHHITGGGSYAYAENRSIDFGFMFAPKSNVSGVELTPRGVVPGSNINVSMHQVAFSIGWTRKW